MPLPVKAPLSSLAGLAFVLIGAIAGGAKAADMPVPKAIQGVWASHGRCDLPRERITITARRAGWGAGPFSRVHYDPESKAVFWDQEYVVDNFEPGYDPDVLVHNTQGFHMPGAVGLARCGPKLVRRPWPPHKRAR